MHYKILSLISDFRYLYVRAWASLLFACFAFVLWYLGFKLKARDLCAASLRYGFKSSTSKLLRKILIQIPYGMVDVTSGVELKEAAVRSIIIKWPEYRHGKIIKGVFVITYTRTSSYYIKNINLEKLTSQFNLILEPSSSGYADPDILWFFGKFNNVIVCAPENEDRVLLNCFPESFISASFGAGDWVNHTSFVDKKMQKIYDSIYIANTKPLKRVKRYLDAVSNIVNTGNPNYVGCLVCASWGGGEKLIRDLVAGYNLGGNIILKMALGRDQVIDHLNQSKVNILLSYKEGSSRSLFESMFCNVPVICLSENIGVNKSYINEHTGLLVPNNYLEESLLWISANHQLFNARDWALKNISPHVTVRKIAELINSRNLCGDSLLVADDLFVKTNDPEVSYLEAPNVNHREYVLQLLALFDIRNIEAEKETILKVMQLKRSFDRDYM